MSISWWASSKPTAAPIIIVTRISSASSVCTAWRRSLDVGLAGRLEHLLLVGGVEPLRLVERGVEDALQRRGILRDEALGLLELRGVGERLNGGFDLGVGVRTASGH